MTALIIALSVLLLCAAAFVYVLIRLLMAILSLDSAIAREIFALRSGRPLANYNIGAAMAAKPTEGARSEERRVGKECRSRWSPYH